MEGTQIVGVVHAEDIQKIPYEARFQAPISSVMRKISDLPIIAPDSSGKAIFLKLNEIKTSPRIGVVVDNNQILGFVSEDEVVAGLKYIEPTTQRIP